ncbi:MAG: flavodoxin family protein [Candidatus Helarchaeota archaeon]
MKILITYDSQSGNTEEIAKSMAEGIEGEVICKPVENVDPNNLANFDIIFLGSGVYANGAGKKLNKLVKNAEALPEKVVLFCTHTNPDPAMWDGVFKKIKKELAKKNANLIAEFDCIGENKNPQIVEMLLKTQPNLKEGIEAAKGHPDAADLENAKKFAASLLQKIIA